MTRRAMSLEAELLAWDGKSAADGRAIHERCSSEPDYITELISLIGKDALRNGVTWLLKAALETGTVITQKDADILYNNLHVMNHWEQKLHVLQCIAFMPIGEDQKEKLERFLRQCLAHNNKFVRAWAYSGFYYLAKQHKEYREETRRLFKLALHDDAASVKARARKLAKRSF